MQFIESQFSLGHLPAMIYPTRKPVLWLFYCFIPFWIWLSTRYSFQLLQYVSILFLLANKYACYYKFAMVVGKRYKIIFLSEKLKMQILKSVLCYERATWLVFPFFIPKHPERTSKKKREFRTPCHIIWSCVYVHF